MKRVIIALFIMILLAALLFAEEGFGGNEVSGSETPVLDPVPIRFQANSIPPALSLGSELCPRLRQGLEASLRH